MSGLTPSQLERWTGGRWLRGYASDASGSLAIDARNLSHGDVFVALRTGRRDGHEFVVQAASAGASAAIVEHGNMQTQLPQLIVPDTLDALHRIGAAARREFKGPVTAITGSCGKTSTKELLALLLGEKVLSTAGNLNNYIGLPITLSRLANADWTSAVVEVGISLSGEMTPLAKIASPDSAIVTCVAPAHLAGLGSIEGVAAEKCALLSSVARSHQVFFPADCLKFAPFRELSAHCLVTARMGDETPDLPAPNYRLVRHQCFSSAVSGRSEILVFMPSSPNFMRFAVPRLSAGMQSNAVLAIAAAIEAGVAEADIRARLALWKPAALRGEILREGNVEYYVDCYNANPASMLDAVRNFRESFPTTRRLYLFGCMNELGGESVRLHRELGAAIGAQGDERACVLGTEAAAFSEGLVAGGARTDRVVAAANRDEVTASLDAFKINGGAVFVKGSRSYRMEEFIPANLISKVIH
ncbi:MAG TPA: UDP-N-acetylmuramoyl-tripeptide--D-alanyl-D-alanine ligase [Opitutales bacterium]|nr:UDP-N-acetylmuramoyl-tripeptide--D-alanyl-D-alanine ligase [Opitutales bacterium]